MITVGTPAAINPDTATAYVFTVDDSVGALPQGDFRLRCTHLIIDALRHLSAHDHYRAVMAASVVDGLITVHHLLNRENTCG